MQTDKYKWLNTCNDEQFWLNLQSAVQELERKYAPQVYNSSHEMYSVLAEELDEFWDSVKANDPDPEELLQLSASAITGILWLCRQAKERQNRIERMRQ